MKRVLERTPYPLRIGILFLTLALAASHSSAQTAFVPSDQSQIDASDSRTYTAILHAGEQDPPDQNPPAKPPARAPEPTRKPRYVIYVGPDLGVYLPTSAKTRSRFGSSWFSFGAGITPVYASTTKGRFSPDLQFISQSSGDDYAFFGLLGLEYRQALVKRHRRATKSDAGAPGAPAANADSAEAQQKDKPKTDHKSEPETLRNYIPYFGFTVDEAVGDLRSIEDNIHSGVRTGVAGSAFLGVTFRNRAYFEARYTQTSVLKSFDLSGFILSAGVRFRLAGS